MLSVSAWQNPIDPLNVNDDYWEDGRPLISPIDVLIGYNALNDQGPRTLPVPASPPPYFDVNGDGNHTPSDLLPIINYLNVYGAEPGEGGGFGDYQGHVDVRLEATVDGIPVSALKPGDRFVLRAYVRDDQAEPAGIFAAYIDVLYDASLVSENGPVMAGPDYQNIQSAGYRAEGIDEAGGTSFFNPLGAGEFLLFEMPFSAVGPGRVTFSSSPAIGLGHEILVYGNDSPVAVEQVDYGSITLEIAEFSAIDDFFVVGEDSELNVLDVLPNDMSTLPTPITIAAVEGPYLGGAVVLSDDQQQVIYTPAANFFGFESFTYTIESGSLTSTATVTVLVYEENDPPTAADDYFTVDANDVPVSFDVLANDTSYPDSPELLTISVVTLPDQGGLVAIAADGLSVQYTPPVDFIGLETFVYTISDGNGGTAQATVAVTVVPSFSFVDANNNGTFETGLDVPLIHGELEDGSFRTTKREGGYTNVIAGAGLVIKDNIAVDKDIDFRADGNVVVRGSLQADRDVSLRGNAMDVLAGISAGQDASLSSEGDIRLSGATLVAERDIRLEAGASIQATGSTLHSLNRDVVVAANQNALFDTASITAGRDIDVRANGYLSAAGAVFDAGRDVALRAKGADPAAVEAYVPSPWIQVAMTLDFANVRATRNIDLKADQGSVALYSSITSAGKTIDVSAHHSVFAEFADLTAGRKIWLDADEIIGWPSLHAPKIKITTG